METRSSNALRKPSARGFAMRRRDEPVILNKTAHPPKFRWQCAKSQNSFRRLCIKYNYLYHIYSGFALLVAKIFNLHFKTWQGVAHRGRHGLGKQWLADIQLFQVCGFPSYRFTEPFFCPVCPNAKGGHRKIGKRLNV